MSPQLDRVTHPVAEQATDAHRGTEQWIVVVAQASVVDQHQRWTQLLLGEPGGQQSIRLQRRQARNRSEGQHQRSRSQLALQLGHGHGQIDRGLDIARVVAGRSGFDEHSARRRGGGGPHQQGQVGLQRRIQRTTHANVDAMTRSEPPADALLVHALQSVDLDPRGQRHARRHQLHRPVQTRQRLELRLGGYRHRHDLGPGLLGHARTDLPVQLDANALLVGE